MTGSGSMFAHDPGELTAHVLGMLGPEEARAVEEHLATCADCRREWNELRETAAALDAVPPETFIDGPPGADLVLQRTLRQVRAETGATRRRRRFALVAAAAVVVASLLGGGVLLGRALAPETAVVALPPGTRTGQGVEGGVTMSASVSPARGWVRVSATVQGIPAGQKCTILVVGRDGSENVAGSWLASPNGETSGTTLSGSAIIAPEDVLAVAIRSDTGRDFITVLV